MRRVLPIVLAALTFAALASPAAAAKPSRDPLEIAPELLAFPAGAACDFPVHIEILLNREYIKTWTDADGNPIRDQINGSLRIRLVNDLTGASVDLNVGGPGRNLYHGDGTMSVVFLGNALPIFEGVFYLTRGFHSFEVNVADFSLIEIGPAHGRIIDACAMIA
jgi:hypothetical protein